jgi:hypothetical protein
MHAMNTADWFLAAGATFGVAFGDITVAAYVFRRWRANRRAKR